ncbi:hypothetical protein [Fusobacterium phage Fnu1]|uniref:Uncharacterized protein n=1 Tax=Fusobacterium phage Fnu1 TaxID=2530024 RepID=A0A481W653_9CAUD|nr:hypothetical protein KMD24_gp070 [Fusobacterium phage Fnu1]QBJ04100.1 hypothetical protein [Fusobacterium phage Fnu1]
MKKIILQTQKVFNGKYVFTLEMNFESVEQWEDIIYYVKTDNYSVYKHNAYWNILDKITHIDYSENRVINKTQLKELSELINKINKDLNSDRVKGQKYYYIDSDLTIRESKDLFCAIDNTYYDLGNYFKDIEKAKETVIKLKEFWKGIKETQNTQYYFTMSNNIEQINNLPTDIKDELLNKILKVCEIADRKQIKFTIGKGNINREKGLSIKFSKPLEIQGIKNIEYVEVGTDYLCGSVVQQPKYIVLDI